MGGLASRSIMRTKRYNQSCGSCTGRPSASIRFGTRTADVQTFAHAARRHTRSPWRNTSRHELSLKIRIRQVKIGSKAAHAWASRRQANTLISAPALWLFVISSRGGTNCCKRRRPSAKAATIAKASAPVVTQKVHGKHLSRIEGQGEHPIRANASIYPRARSSLIAALGRRVSGEATESAGSTPDGRLFM